MLCNLSAQSNQEGRPVTRKPMSCEHKAALAVTTYTPLWKLLRKVLYETLNSATGNAEGEADLKLF